MNIQILFSTPEREKIMVHLLYNPNKKINMHEIARAIEVSPSQVHKYISILRKYGMVKDNLLQDSQLIRSLRLLQNLIKIENKKLIILLRKSIPKIKGIGIYGSWNKGSNDETADLDVWIKIPEEIEDLKIAKIRKKLEKRILTTIDLTIVTLKRLEHMREKNPSFYFSLYNSITLWGEGL